MAKRATGQAATQIAPPEKLVVNTKQAADMLGMSVRFLEVLRYQGGGPAFVKLGERVRYRVQDIEAWVEERVRTSTADTGTR